MFLKIEPNLKSLPKKSLKDDKERIKVSSKGKRLFSFLLDFIIALLIVNTISQIARKEHWDLALGFRDVYELIPFYGSILLLLFFRDIFGSSPGKFLLGMKICLINDYSNSPSFFVLLSRNIFLLIFPLEGVFLLKDGYARRYADKLFRTVVVDKKESLRPILRIFLGNIILFGFFSIAILFQRSNIEKSAAYQIAIETIRNDERLKKFMEKNPLIEEPEMHLDLRDKQRKSSVIGVRVGDEELGKSVKVFLELIENPKNWVVVDLVIEPFIKSSD